MRCGGGFATACRGFVAGFFAEAKLRRKSIMCIRVERTSTQVVTLYGIRLATCASRWICRA